MASVSIDNVVKKYGTLEVLHGASVSVSDGELLVLVGPSGCGKSTLLRMIAGLEEISDGTISIGGTVVNNMPPKERNIAMVFQNYALYPHMSVAQNMAFSLRLARIPKNEIKQKVEDTATILGLGELLDRYPGQLSGGQRQRVAMGRAIVRKPEVFLFDEPLSNLDAKLRVQMRAEIKQLHQRLKTTTIYVTHDQTEAMTLADRIVVMRNGIIEQIGSPLDLYDHPNNLFVAGFIGSPAMNFISGEVKDGKFYGPGGIAIQISQLPDMQSRKRIVCGIRPDKTCLGDTGAPAKVLVVEPMGGETLLLVQVEESQLTCVLHERISVQPGDSVNLDLSSAPILLFDQDTGLSLPEAAEELIEN